MGYKFALFVLESFLHLKQGTASNEHLKMDAQKFGSAEQEMRRSAFRHALESPSKNDSNPRL